MKESSFLRFGKHLSILAALALALLAVAPAAAQGEAPGDDPFAPDHEFADPAFQDRWSRTDMPVAEGEVDRSWLWAPGPFTDGLMEPYAESPGGERLVQYFDKSRMEINQPDQAEDSLWHVTNGLLVVEMVDGKYQIGEEEFDESPDPAEQNIAGDPESPFGPTYADIKAFGLRAEPATPEGETLTMTVTEDGEVTTDEAFAEYGVVASERVQVPAIDHTIAGPFWEFMNSVGTVWVDGEYTEAQLFQNPFYATGYPITEAYWNTFAVDGTERDVLWQCFERRCLTYTPGNPEGFVVEAANVGQHYYRWRFGDSQPEPGADTANIHLVALEDAGQSGMLIGCDDSLIPVEIEIASDLDTAGKIEAALSALFGVDEEFYGESGLYNSLYQSNLAVTDAAVDESAVATVNIDGEFAIGGVCDEPRFIEQIRQTVLQFDDVTDANIMVNGTPLADLFGPGNGDGDDDGDGETQTVELFFALPEDPENGGENGENATFFGCNDTLVSVETEVAAADAVNEDITLALQALFEEDATAGPNDEYVNALSESDLTVADVTVEEGVATVSLSGEYAVAGECAEPRFVVQIMQTVLQFEGVDVAEVTIDGESIYRLFPSMSLGEGALATFDVNGEVFQLWTTNITTIEQLLDLQEGVGSANIPIGPLVEGPGVALHNFPWSWHLDPELTEMAEVAIGVCDATPSHVEQNFEEFMADVGQYCPWSAELIHLQDFRTAETES